MSSIDFIIRQRRHLAFSFIMAIMHKNYMRAAFST
jgi:hypothetical protein